MRLVAAIPLILFVASCAGENKTLAVCEETHRLYDKLATCESIPASSRETLVQIVKDLRANMAKYPIEKAPPEHLKLLQETCKKSKASVLEMASKYWPDCPVR